MISRSLTADESLRPDDVANAVPCEQDRASKLLLGVPGNVAADHGQTDTEAQALEVAQPERHEPAPFVGRGQSNQQRGAQDTDRVGDNHGYAAAVGPPCADPAADDQRQELYRTARDLEVLSSQGVEAEGFNNDGGKLCPCQPCMLRMHRSGQVMNDNVRLSAPSWVLVHPLLV